MAGAALQTPSRRVSVAVASVSGSTVNSQKVEIASALRGLAKLIDHLPRHGCHPIASELPIG
jgi:hypothetical protein